MKPDFKRVFSRLEPNWNILFVCGSTVDFGTGCTAKIDSDRDVVNDVVGHDVETDCDIVARAVDAGALCTFRVQEFNALEPGSPVAVAQCPGQIATAPMRTADLR